MAPVVRDGSSLAPSLQPPSSQRPSRPPVLCKRHGWPGPCAARPQAKAQHYSCTYGGVQDGHPCTAGLEAFVSMVPQAGLSPPLSLFLPWQPSISAPPPLSDVAVHLCVFFSDNLRTSSSVGKLAQNVLRSIFVWTASDAMLSGAGISPIPGSATKAYTSQANIHKVHTKCRVVGVVSCFGEARGKHMDCLPAAFERLPRLFHSGYRRQGFF